MRLFDDDVIMSPLHGNIEPSKSERASECLLTLREAAEILRLHPRTVREYVRRGELEGRLIGRRWRFNRKNLDAFYENAPRWWDFKGNSEHGD